MRLEPCTGNWRSAWSPRGNTKPASIANSAPLLGEKGMDGKIALEEHFAIEETLSDSAGFVPEDHWPELRSRLLDIQSRRLAEMDRHGVEMMILSLNAPAVQAVFD